MKPRFIHGENCPNNCNSLIIGIRCSVCWSHWYCQVQSNSKPHLHSSFTLSTKNKPNSVDWLKGTALFWRETLFTVMFSSFSETSRPMFRVEIPIAFCYLSWLIPFFGMCFSTCRLSMLGEHLHIHPINQLFQCPGYPGYWSTSWSR